MRSYGPYKDSLGFLVGKSGTRQRSSFYTSLYYLSLYFNSNNMRKWYSKDFKILVNKLSDASMIGRYKVHPKIAPIYDHQKYMESEKVLPFLISLGAYNFKNELWALFLYAMKGNIRNENGCSNNGLDCNSIPGKRTRFISEFIRAFRAWWCYPILLFSDIALLVDILKIRKEERTDGDFNALARILQAKAWLPTPISCIARYFYKKRKRVNLPTQLPYKPVSNIQAALLKNAMLGNFEMPPLDEAFQNIVEYRL